MEHAHREIVEPLASPGGVDKDIKVWQRLYEIISRYKSVASLLYIYHEYLSCKTFGCGQNNWSLAVMDDKHLYTYILLLTKRKKNGNAPEL